jgi:hypothetical protein
MDEGILKGWVDAYGRAWQTGDPDAATLLFAEEATYQETPFAEPARGRHAIHAYWSLVREHHKDVEFIGTILSVNPAIARCRATYVNRKTGEPTKFDGIFLLEFDAENPVRVIPGVVACRSQTRLLSLTGRVELGWADSFEEFRVLKVPRTTGDTECTAPLLENESLAIKENLSKGPKEYSSAVRDQSAPRCRGIAGITGALAIGGRASHRDSQVRTLGQLLLHRPRPPVLGCGSGPINRPPLFGQPTFGLFPPTEDERICGDSEAHIADISGESARGLGRASQRFGRNSKPSPFPALRHRTICGAKGH